MELISYAMDFVSFFIQKSKNANSIKSIILFGSVARNQATQSSDVDIFVDVLEKEEEINKEIKKITADFYDSVKYKNYWTLLGIQNEINVIASTLNKWKIKDSMLGSSLVLYGQFSQKQENGTNKTIICWENIKNNSNRVMLNKKLFGYKHYKHEYKGIIQTHNGIKLGANVILIPTEYLPLFLQELRKFKAKTKINNIFEYTN